MSDAKSRRRADNERLWPLFMILSVLLILRLLWAVFVPGGGWPLSPVHFMYMAIDLAMTVGVFGIGSQLLKDLPERVEGRKTIKILMPTATLCGIGLLLIRLTSRAAWWTGHLNN